MNKNAIVFSLNVHNEHSKIYYAMLYQALKTLSKFYLGHYDVVVYYTFTNQNYSFENFAYKDKYNMYKEFGKFVKFIETDYDKRYDTTYVLGQKNLADPWMAKWYHMVKAIELGYDKIFYTDCDVLFYSDVGYLFHQYADDEIAVLFCSANPLLLDTRPVSSGQFVIHKNFFGDTATFFDKVLEKRKILNDRGEHLHSHGKISRDEVLNWYFFNEQHCGQMVFEDNGANFVQFDEMDYVTPAWSNIDKNHLRNMYTLQIVDNNIKIKNVLTSVIHYSLAHVQHMLPVDLLPEKFKAYRKTWIERNRNDLL